MADSKKTWVPARECAERLELTPRQVLRYIEKRDVPCLKQAGVWYVCLEDTRDHWHRIQAAQHPQVDIDAIAQEAHTTPPAHLPPPDEVGWEAQVASLRARVALLEYQTDQVRPARWTHEQAAKAFHLFATFPKLPHNTTIVPEFVAMLPSLNDSLRHAWIDQGHTDRLWPRVIHCIEHAMRTLVARPEYPTTIEWQVAYQKMQIQLDRIRSLALEEMPYPDRVKSEEALHVTTQSSILDGLLRTLHRRAKRESCTAFSLVSAVYHAMQAEVADEATRSRWADALRDAVGMIESNVIGRPLEANGETTDHPLDRLVESARVWEASGGPASDRDHPPSPHTARMPTQRPRQRRGKNAAPSSSCRVSRAAQDKRELHGDEEGIDDET